MPVVPRFDTQARELAELRRRIRILESASLPGHLRSGVGVPTGGSDGDYYLRTDTPGTANQRIYVRSGGTWTGIV